MDEAVVVIFKAAWFLTKVLFRIPIFLIHWIIYLVGQIPKEYHASNTSRFEHTLIVGGSGHGKTQLIQSLFTLDLPGLIAGRQSVVIIDSQGDMIHKILSLAALTPGQPLSDRLVLIDPTDTKFPPALNLFDFGFDKLQAYDSDTRADIISSTLALYTYMFSSLLEAEMTNRQETLFRYLMQLILHVPNPTIYTLLDFIDEPDLVRPYLPKLSVDIQRFFLKQYLSANYSATRNQISNRLWGLIADETFRNMFSHTENKLNLFEAMNRGSIILIHTAKARLQQEGCQLFGRFMITLINQATLRRAILPVEKRLPTFVFIDEAQDYFGDEGLGILLNQARKYNVGLTLATQNLGHFSSKLLQTVLSSTSVKYAGGVSDHDATIMAREMHTTADSIMGLHKTDKGSAFAVYDKNMPRREGQPPTAYFVTFGDLEGQPKMSAEQKTQLLTLNRERFCAPYDPNLLLTSQAVINSGVQFELEAAKAV